MNDTYKNKSPVVFIHGLWSTPEIWLTFRDFYRDRGYTVHTPQLRHHEFHTANLQSLSETSMADYLNDLTEFINRLDQKPILIGHSMGALLALQLASKGLAEQAILLSPLAPAGYFGLHFHTLKSLANIFRHWGFWRQAIKLSSKDANFAVLNQLPDEARPTLYQEMVHESGRALSEVFFWFFDRNRTTKVKKSIPCRVLVMAGRHDHISPATVCRNVARDYGADYMLLENHGHWLPTETGRERIAEQSEIWLTLEAETQPVY